MTMSYDDFYTQAQTYIYNRSIILAQDETIIRYLADELRRDIPLPENDKEFAAFARRYLRAKLPAGQVDDKQLAPLVRYYTKLGKIPRQRKWLKPLAYLLAAGLLIAVIIASVTAIFDDTSQPDINTAAITGRIILLVGAVVMLYYWVSWKVKAALTFVRITLLLALILALLWLLHDNGMINLNSLLNLNT